MTSMSGAKRLSKVNILLHLRGAFISRNSTSMSRKYTDLFLSLVFVRLVRTISANANSNSVENVPSTAAKILLISFTRWSNSSRCLVAIGSFFLVYSLQNSMMLPYLKNVFSPSNTLISPTSSFSPLPPSCSSLIVIEDPSWEDDEWCLTSSELSDESSPPASELSKSRRVSARRW